MFIWILPHSTGFITPDSCIVVTQFCFDILVFVYLFCLFCITKFRILSDRASSYNSGRWPTWRTISSIICLFETYYRRNCASSWSLARTYHICPKGFTERTVMYRKQEGGLETPKIVDFTDNHACNMWQNTLLVIVSWIVYLSLKMHTMLSWPTMVINRQWIQKMNFGRDGYLQNLWSYICDTAKTDLRSSPFTVKYTMIMRQP